MAGSLRTASNFSKLCRQEVGPRSDCGGFFIPGPRWHQLAQAWQADYLGHRGLKEIP